MNENTQNLTENEAFDTTIQTEENTEEAIAVDLAALPELVHALEQDLAKALKESEEHKALYMRTLADFQNFRRRQQEELKQAQNGMLRDFIAQLLPVLDNFERALQAAGVARDFDVLMGGIQMTDRQVKQLLEKYEARPIDSIGQIFDPNLHEAIQRVEMSDKPEGTIIDEIERGYMLGDRVLRPSRVIVSVPPSRPDAGGVDTTA